MITLYYTNVTVLKEPVFFEKCLSLVQEQRKKKVLNKKNEDEQRRSLAAGLLLRYAFGQANQSYEDAVIHIGERGKPECREDIFFNLSHAGEIAVCAWGDLPLGVDVEDTSRFKKMSSERLRGIAMKSFSQKENHSLEDDNWNAESFGRIWTRKESYVKYTGTGIGTNLSKVDTNSNNYITIKLNNTYICSAYCPAVGDDKHDRNKNISNMKIHYVNLLEEI